MPPDRSVPITQILAGVLQGSRTVAKDLFPLVYDELHQIASAKMFGERAGHTLQTTALVHEAYLRLLGREHVDWKSRGHFFGAAAEAMRRILVDHARAKNRQKRGGGRHQVPLPDDKLSAVNDADTEAFLVIDQALERLEKVDDRMAQVVKLRFFAGVTIEETAQLLDVTPRTINRAWNEARVWLRRELSESSDPMPQSFSS